MRYGIARHDGGSLGGSSLIMFSCQGLLAFNIYWLIELCGQSK